MTEPFTGSANALTPGMGANAKPLDLFNAVIREVGEQEGALVIDLVRNLQEKVLGWNQGNEIFIDGIHVTEKGSRIYAQQITENLLPLINSKISTSAAKGPQPIAGR